MIKRALLVLLVLGAVLTLSGYLAYRSNMPHALPAISTGDAASGNKPIVVKLHAKWCPVCLFTKKVWSEVEQTYSGRVNLLVLDFTNQETTDRSRAEADRLGITAFFDEYGGATGTVAVLHGRTRKVAAYIQGSRDFAVYREAIDAALRDAEKPAP